MTIRATIARLVTLNTYLPHLPCLADSEDAAARSITRENQPFTESMLCNIIMRMIPGDWEAQYYLSEKYVPADVRKLQSILERIEGAKAIQKRNEQPKQSVSTGGANKPGKRSGEEIKGRIPKKTRSERTEKHCIHCKKNGGPHKTHNTLECRIYDKDGNKKQKGKSYSQDKASKATFAQLSAKYEKLEKS